MRAHTHRPAVVATATLILLAASGCSSNGSPAPATTPKASLPAPSTASPTGAQIEATAQAGEALKRYVAGKDQMSQNPSTYTPAKAAAIAGGAALTSLTASMTTFKDEGLHSLGHGLIVSMPLEAVDLTSTPDAKPPGLPSVTFNVCYNRAKVDIVDSLGKSQVEPDRTPQVTIHYRVSNQAWPAANGWRVYLVDSGDTSCTG